MTSPQVLLWLGDLGRSTPSSAASAHAHRQLRALWGRPGTAPDRGGKTRHGRPRSPVPGHDFSITHDDGLVGVALGEVRLGLDAMRWRTVRPAVAGWLRGLPDLAAGTRVTGPWAALVRWTQVEAVIKYAGASLLQEWHHSQHGRPTVIDRFVGAGGRLRTWTSTEGVVSLAHWRPCDIAVLAASPTTWRDAQPVDHLPAAAPDDFGQPPFSPTTKEFLT